MSVTAVNFGGTPATSFTVNSPTQITAVAPAGVGTVNVTVVTTSGSSAVGAGNQYTYAAALTIPVITSANAVTATEGTAFSYTITASGNPAPTFAITGQPPWLSLSGAVVSGTPPAGSGNTSVSFQATATNSEGTSPPVTVTVTIAEPAAGWSIEWTFTGPAVIGTEGNISLNSIPGWNPAWNADMTEDLLYDLPSMAAMPVNLYVKFSSDAAWVGPIHFDNWGPGTAAPNSIRSWGYNEVNHRIEIRGSNSTGQPIQLMLVKS